MGIFPILQIKKRVSVKEDRHQTIHMIWSHKYKEGSRLNCSVGSQESSYPEGEVIGGGPGGDSGDPEMVHALIWVVTMQISFGDNSSAYT